jgi:hypothetical protein
VSDASTANLADQLLCQISACTTTVSGSIISHCLASVSIPQSFRLVLALILVSRSLLVEFVRYRSKNHNTAIEIKFIQGNPITVVDCEYRI